MRISSQETKGADQLFALAAREVQQVFGDIAVKDVAVFHRLEMNLRPRPPDVFGFKILTRDLFPGIDGFHALVHCALKIALGLLVQLRQKGRQLQTLLRSQSGGFFLQLCEAHKANVAEFGRGSSENPRESEKPV